MVRTGTRPFGWVLSGKSSFPSSLSTTNAVQITTQHSLKEPLFRSAKPDYSFVNWVRLVAMFSIVYEHCLNLHNPNESARQLINGNVHWVQSVSQTQAMPWIVQPLKFGTICFFLISGYLLGKHLSPSDSPWLYYRRRLQVVGIPYLIAAGLFFLLTIRTVGILRGRYDVALWTPTYLLNSFQSSILFSSYWFILSFLIVLGLFLLIWPKSEQPWFGWLTGAISLFYGLNVYFNWVEQRHNLAMPAYLFYLWAGVWLSRRNTILGYLQRLPNAELTGALLLSLMLAVIESTYLWQLQSISPFNSLRLSNQLFSVLAFVWLLRNDFSHRFTWLNPRTESFGIYLYHLYFILFVNIWSESYGVLVYRAEQTGLELAGTTLVRCLLIYGLTLLFVKVVNRTPLRRLLGG